MLMRMLIAVAIFHGTLSAPFSGHGCRLSPGNSLKLYKNKTLKNVPHEQRIHQN